VSFQENPSNGSRDTAEKVYCSSIKVLFIIKGSQPILIERKEIEFEQQPAENRNWKGKNATSANGVRMLGVAVCFSVSGDERC